MLAKLTSPFDEKETLFYKSVTRVTILFAFLPFTPCVMAETERYQEVDAFTVAV
ncbi:hypothetical protein L8O12_03140 [Enterobacter kobei]|uniref:hypothetical protein n=1 Tax=Enterobacter kobei TaxID=208224 RepID=UPI00200554E3|nr:hypothetical protein [Enterobacter kobei]MCK7154450.1 hypothetical protein [Enterobacter kobei]